jgi:hypothetical protein
LTNGKKRVEHTWGFCPTSGQSASELHAANVMLQADGILAQPAPSHSLNSTDGCAPALASQMLKSNRSK